MGQVSKYLSLHGKKISNGDKKWTHLTDLRTVYIINLIEIIIPQWGNLLASSIFRSQHTHLAFCDPSGEGRAEILLPQ